MDHCQLQISSLAFEHCCIVYNNIFYLPKIEASTRTNIDETRHPELDLGHDSAHVVTSSPPPIHR